MLVCKSNRLYKYMNINNVLCNSDEIIKDIAMFLHNVSINIAKVATCRERQTVALIQRYCLGNRDACRCSKCLFNLNLVFCMTSGLLVPR